MCFFRSRGGVVLSVYPLPLTYFMVSGSYDVNNETDSEAASLVASHLAAYDEILTLKSVVRNARHLTVMSYHTALVSTYFINTSVLSSVTDFCVSGWSDKFELSPGPRVWLTSGGGDHWTGWPHWLSTPDTDILPAAAAQDTRAPCVQTSSTCPHQDGAHRWSRR